MERPIAATLLGALNLFFGLWGVCGTMVGIGSIALMLSVNPGESGGVPDNNPFAMMMEAQTQALSPINLFAMAVAAIMAGLYVASGIGLVMTRPWGRTLGIAVSIFAMVYFVVFDVGLAIKNKDMAMEMVAGQTGQALPPSFGNVMLVASILTTSIFHLLFPLIEIFFLNRPVVKAAFEARRPT